MSLWISPIPPLPALRSRYPTPADAPAPSVTALVAGSVVLAVFNLLFLLPSMDALTTRIIRAFWPPYDPPGADVQTEYQALQRLLHRTALAVGHLVVLWPLVIILLLVAVEVLARTLGINARGYAAWVWIFAEIFMSGTMLGYWQDITKLLLQFDGLRRKDLVAWTETLFRQPSGESKVLGYDRFGSDIKLSHTLLQIFKHRALAETENFRDKVASFVTESTPPIIVTIVDRSSGTLCPTIDSLWSPCGPLLRLYIPVGSNLLFFVLIPVIQWWIKKYNTLEDNTYGWAPTMCQKKLKQRASMSLSLHGKYWREIWDREREMQKDGLLWGCPWKPNRRQMESWIR